MNKVIAFQGEAGANSHIACKEVYPDFEPLGCATFEDAFAAVSDGPAALAMIPTAALGIAAGAYYLARRYSSDPRFAFGTWKIEVLGGYTSALLLLGVAAYMGFESIVRLVRPATIHFDEAIPIAIVGLAVNMVSAWLL